MKPKRFDAEAYKRRISDPENGEQARKRCEETAKEYEAKAAYLLMTILAASPGLCLFGHIHQKGLAMVRLRQTVLVKKKGP